MDNVRPPKRGIPALLFSIASGALRIAGCMLCLAVLAGIDRMLPFVRPFLWRLTLLGTWFSLFFEFVVRVPNFPFWSAMQLFVTCAGLLWLDYALEESSG